MAVEAHHLHLHNSSSIYFPSKEFVDSQSIHSTAHMALVNAPVAGTGNTVDCSETVSRKRPRINNIYDFSSNVQQQMVVNDDERLVLHHAEKARAEIMERRRFAKQVMTMVEERASKRLREKEDEIEQILKLNWALEEKMKSLVAENQVWRYLAQANEATGIALRTSLEQALSEQLRVKEEQMFASALAAADDEESCCGDNVEADESDARDWREL